MADAARDRLEESAKVLMRKLAGYDAWPHGIEQIQEALRAAYAEGQKQGADRAYTEGQAALIAAWLKFTERPPEEFNRHMDKLGVSGCLEMLARECR